MAFLEDRTSAKFKGIVKKVNQRVYIWKTWTEAPWTWAKKMDFSFETVTLEQIGKQSIKIFKNCYMLKDILS